MELLIRTESADKTYELGITLGGFLESGDFISFVGDLGAGKTLFIKGIATGLGVDSSDVTSPTFTLINEYQSARLPIYHFDVYRLDHPAQLEDLGYEEYFYGKGICLVEWGDAIRDYLPINRLSIELQKDGESSRTIKFIPHGTRYEELVRCLNEEVSAG